MRVLHLSTSDVIGGAAKAAYRLHSGLRASNVDSMMFVLDKRTTDASVVRFEPPGGSKRIRRLVRRERLRRTISSYPMASVGGWSPFSDDRTEFGGDPVAQMPPADLLHLHWVAGFVDPTVVLGTFDGPIVWTAHDMNPFTGGCHYDGGCGRYVDRCGRCPILGSDRETDLSRRLWTRRSGAISRLPEDRLNTIVSSQWMADKARESSLLGRCPITVVPNGIDTSVFSPKEKAIARGALDLPADSPIVMFVADRLDDPRKGFAFLVEALTGIEIPELLLVTVGGGIAELPGTIRHRALGHIPNESLLALAYSAASVVAVPSLQEAMGATALESLACGTPVVGFDTGGLADIVRPGLNGALAPVGDAAGLRGALSSVVASPDRAQQMAAAARHVAETEYDLGIQVDRHIKFYGRLL